MSYSEDERDALNDETFGQAEIGDWELEHERFVLQNEGFDCDAPDADTLPRFWETSNDFSFLWQHSTDEKLQDYLDDERNERGVNVEETIQKLVSDDETFEDPAILDLSKKPREMFSTSLDQIIGAPAYPLSPANGSHDIWGSTGLVSPVRCVVPRCSEPSTESHRDSVKHFQQEPLGTHKLSSGIPLSINDLIKLVERNKNENDGGVSVSVGSNAPPSVKGVDIQSPLVGSCVAGSERVSNPVSSLSGSTCAPSSSDHLMEWFSQMQLYNSLRPRLSPTVTALPTVRFPSILPFGRTDLFQSIRLLNAQQIASKLRASQALLSDRNPLPYLSLSRGVPIPSSARFPALPILPLPIPSPTIYRSVSPFFPQSRPDVPLSSDVRMRSVDMRNQTRVAGPIFLDAADSHESFDPNVGSWMTHYESVGVLLMYLRPLIVSNPYIQDYYFAVRWLRQMYANRSKQLSSGAPTISGPLPVMHMPSPLSVENLADCSHHHHTSLSHKLIVPLAALHHTKVGANSAPGATSAGTQSKDSTSHSIDTEKVSDAQESSSNPPISSAKDSIHTLGRATRSNVNRPRVISDLSVSSALTVNQDEESVVPEDVASTISSPQQSDVCSLKSSRLNRLLLARVERMYTLILHVDEVDISLSRVVVQNDMRFRLMCHRQGLVEKLTRELMCPSTQSSPSIDLGRLNLSDSSDCSGLFAELLHVRKGLRLFSTILYYLPPGLLQICLRDFILHFDRLLPFCLPFPTECVNMLYPSLRNAIYHFPDIVSFMRASLPESTTILSPTTIPNPNLQAMITSKLGLSLIACLLDSCARLSRPDDPSCFIRNAAYFSHITATSRSGSGAESSIVQPYEPFPHLASIIPVYVQPDRHQPLTSEELQQFCALMRCQTELPNSKPAVHPPTSSAAPSSSEQTACDCVIASPPVFAT